MVVWVVHRERSGGYEPMVSILHCSLDLIGQRMIDSLPTRVFELNIASILNRGEDSAHNSQYSSSDDYFSDDPLTDKRNLKAIFSLIHLFLFFFLHPLFLSLPVAHYCLAMAKKVARDCWRSAICSKIERWNLRRDGKKALETESEKMRPSRTLHRK